MSEILPSCFNVRGWLDRQSGFWLIAASAEAMLAMSAVVALAVLVVDVSGLRPGRWPAATWRCASARVGLRAVDGGLWPAMVCC